MITGYEIKIEGEKRYPENEADTISETTAQRLAFSRGAKWMQEQSMRWVSVKDKALVDWESNEWTCTDYGSKPFLAAVPYNDTSKPGQELWWIMHCAIEDQIGLCVVGEDENVPAGWQIEDVTHWMPLPSPPTTE